MGLFKDIRDIAQYCRLKRLSESGWHNHAVIDAYGGIQSFTACEDKTDCKECNTSNHLTGETDAEPLNAGGHWERFNSCVDNVTTDKFVWIKD